MNAIFLNLLVKQLFSLQNLIIFNIYCNYECGIFYIYYADVIVTSRSTVGACIGKRSVPLFSWQEPQAIFFKSSHTGKQDSLPNDSNTGSNLHPSFFFSSPKWQTPTPSFVSYDHLNKKKTKQDKATAENYNSTSVKNQVRSK